MKHGKKLLGLVLTLVLVMGLLPTAALAGGTDVIVRNYAQLAQALADAQKATGPMVIVVDGDGQSSEGGFTWPTTSTTVTLDFPSNVAFTVGDPYFHDTMGTWVIPDNVTVIQKRNISVASAIEVHGAWEMQRPQGGQKPALLFDGTISVLGRVIFQGSSACRISLKSGCQASVRERFEITNLLELEENAVLQHPKSGSSQLTINGGTLKGPQNGSAQVQCSVKAAHFIDSNRVPHLPHLSGNLQLKYVSVSPVTDLICRSGIMDLGSVFLDNNALLNIKSGALVSANVRGVTDSYGDLPPTLSENARLQIDGQLTLKGYQSEVYDITIGQNGILDLPAGISLEWWPERCTKPKIKGTGTIHAHTGTIHGYESHGGINLCSNPTQEGYDLFPLLEDYDESYAAARKRYFDSTIKLVRDWIVDQPADHNYPLDAKILDQNGQPVSGAGIVLKNAAGIEVDQVHHVPGTAEAYSLHIIKPEAMRIRSVQIGKSNWTSNFYETTDKTLDAKSLVQGKQAVVKVTLEPIPDPLPQVTGVQLTLGGYSNELTDLMLESVENRWTYVNLSCANGARLPSSSCAKVNWECSPDGVTWYPLAGSKNAYRFLLGSSGGYKVGDRTVPFDTMRAGYDVRCRVLSLPSYYTADEALYSKVYHINGGGKAGSMDLVLPEDIVITPIPQSSISEIEIPLMVKPASGTCMAAAYDENGRLLYMGSKLFQEAENGKLYITMDLTGFDHLRVFGLSETNVPICKATEKPAN